MSLGRTSFCLLSALFAACTEGEPSASDSGAPVEACEADRDCDDGRFCNGTETCSADDEAADARGCVAGESPCAGDCDDERDRCDTGCGADADGDGDGHDAVECGGDDCDDEDRNRHPGNTEVCDANDHDEDCDPATFGVRDADMDGFPDATCCNTSGAEETCGTDCNDTQAIVHPSEAESCDGLDNDCDSMTDENVLTTYYADADADGYGSAEPGAATMVACFKPMGYADTQDDCNDGSSGVNPGVAELCDEGEPPVDENCDGEANPPAICTCNAGQTRNCLEPGICAVGIQTCNIVTGTWMPCPITGELETCNGVDDNCNGSTDEGTTVACFDDEDNDRFPASGAIEDPRCPDPSRTTVGACPLGTTNIRPLGADIDCNDSNSSVTPGLVEDCNSRDDDCDGATDEGATITCYADMDEDRFPLMSATPQAVCSIPSRSFVGGCPINMTNRTPAMGADCNDADPAVSPAAVEECEGSVDENCDGMIDPASECNCTNGALRMCPAQGACGTGSQTCLDGNWSACSVMPAPETCNMIDDNCNGSTDEGTTVPCYRDNDNDGYSAMGAALTARCPDPSRTSLGSCPLGFTNRAPTGANVDCADNNPARAPAIGENCNMVDDDCDSLTDEGVTVTCYTDMDEDRYPAMGAMPTLYCPAASRPFVGNCPESTTNRTPAMGIDCNDGVSTINPAASEVCEGSVDEDCDGMVDPASDCDCMNGTTRSCPLPGVCGGGTQTCAAGAWSQCSISPITEACDGSDNDCDSSTDETFTCSVGSTQGCSVCGRPVSEGSQTCQAGCSWGTCTATSEECNNCDDNGNGMADEGFTCRQGQGGLACTTACGTTGATGTCNATCDGYVNCYRVSEVCNYCDDTGNGNFDDEASLPEASGTAIHLPTCMSVDHGLNQCESGSGSGQAAFEESRVLDGTTNLGGWINRVQLNGTVEVGHGPIDFRTTVHTRRTNAGNPLDGWAFILTRTGSVGVSGGTDSLGYVRSGLTGYAFEWRWTPGGAAADRVTLRQLNGTDAGGWSVTSAASPGIPASNQLDSTDATTTTVTQTLYIRYTPENSSTGTVEQRLEVWVGSMSGTKLFTIYGAGYNLSCGVTLSCLLTDEIRPGDQLIVATSGMSGPTYGSHTRTRVWWDMGIGFAGQYHATEFTATKTCP